MRRTPLHDEHVALGARMVDFAGWAMPVQYPTGVQQEHLAVRQDAGLFDVSHMGELRVRGPEAAEFLAWATLNDPRRLVRGQGQYSMTANGAGGLVDDLYVYREADDDFLVVANASNVAAVRGHFERLAAEGPPGRGAPFDVHQRDESDDWALLAIQGPTAVVRLGRVVDADLTTVRKNRFVDARLSGMPVRLARTGYTGEDGFEVFARPGDAPAVWQVLLEAGAVPCGLAARDTLRLEAGFPLYGHELGPDTNPLCTPFAWVVKDKAAFGVAALRAAPCARRLVGLVLDGRPIPREGYRVLDETGAAVGTVSSGTLSPLTRRSIALAWVDAAFAGEGTRLAVEVRGQPAPGTVTLPPFYTP